MIDDLLQLVDKDLSPQQLLENYFRVSLPSAQKLIQRALERGGEFSELFFEFSLGHGVLMEEDIIKETSEQVSYGAGIRVIQGEKTGFAFTSLLNESSLLQTAKTAAAIADTGTSLPPATFESTTHPKNNFYDFQQPIAGLDWQQRIKLVQRGYQTAQKYHPAISKVQCGLGDELQLVVILNSLGMLTADLRPQTRMMVLAVAQKNGTRNRGHETGGGRVGLNYFEQEKTPEQIAQNAAEEAVILLEAGNPLAGEMPVVLGAGHSGVMIHEAVGHPMEADGNRKRTSVMTGRLGEPVANPAVTIHDDPTLPHLRGSLVIDDEGTKTSDTILVENGKLVHLLQDRLSAKIMNMNLTGNGRRESFREIPVPRMTNTYLAKGEYDPEEVIGSVKKGFYAKSFQGGQVQESGKFVFSINLGYLIEDGRLTRPVKNATLIGSNLGILQKISMIGNDMGFFLGTCGKEGQSVPVTAGTPTVKIERMTVGGRQ